MPGLRTLFGMIRDLANTGIDTLDGVESDAELGFYGKKQTLDSESDGHDYMIEVADVISSQTIDDTDIQRSGNEFEYLSEVGRMHKLADSQSNNVYVQVAPREVQQVPPSYLLSRYGVKPGASYTPYLDNKKLGTKTVRLVRENDVGRRTDGFSRIASVPARKKYRFVQVAPKQDLDRGAGKH